MATSYSENETSMQGNMDWEGLVLQGVEARQRRDGAQWELGDLALGVETIYGEHRLEEYAESIGVEYDSLREYRRIAKAYENATRVANLPFRHHQELTTRVDRFDWLTLASENHWSVRSMLEHIEEADAEEQRAEEQKRKLDHLRQMSEELEEQVRAGDLSIEDAIAEAIKRAEEERQKQEEHGARMERSRSRLQRLILGWAELRTLPTNPEREDILSGVPDDTRVDIEEIEAVFLRGKQ